MTAEPVDFLDACRHSALGQWPVLVVNAATHVLPLPDVQALRIGLDHAAATPVVDPGAFDILLTERADASRPWVSVPAGRLLEEAERIVQAVTDNPVAGTMLGRLLRIGEALPFAQALDVESLAYSTLLAGGEFAGWMAGRSDPPLSRPSGPLVLIEREGATVTLTLNHPQARNAITAAMRDALHEALATSLDDPSAPKVVLRGGGRCFSTGGDLAEFGTARDLAQAHIIRTARSCTALLDRLGPRATVHLHGACIGSGIEIAAAAARKVAAPDSWFQLPELSMGLIPGAGGTASITRAIGRHRTAWLALTGKRIDARRALDWGLIHEIAA